MTEYTPTTTEVRDRFARDRFDNADSPVSESFRGFDRWFAEHTRQVAERAWDEGFNHTLPTGGGAVYRPFYAETATILA